MTDETSITIVLLLLMLNQKAASAKLREFFMMDNADVHSIVSKLEIAMTKKDKLFCLNVIPDSEWVVGESVRAYYKHSETSHEIGIKESVYEKACEGQPFAVFTFVHEAAHWSVFNSFNQSLTKWASLDEKARRYLRKMHENFADVISVMLLNRESGKACEERRNA